MKKVRIGIIGMGSFGIAEAEIVKSMANAELIAGVRRTPEAAKELSIRFGVPIHQDWRELLDKHTLDMVAITSNNETHREMTLECIKRGIAVHCQKPMGITMDDAKAMRDAANSTGVFMQIGFELRYSLLYSRVKEIIDSGEIGDVVQIYFNYTPGPWTLDTAAWKVKASSGGLFSNKLNHYIDMLRWLIGKPMLDIACTTAPKIIPYYEFTDNVFTTCRFEGGALGHIMFNQTSTALPHGTTAEECYKSGHRLEFNVIGTRGNTHVDIWHPAIRVIHNYDGDRYYPRLDRVEDFPSVPAHQLSYNVQDETRDIINRVASGKREFITPDDAYLTTLACFAADLSIKRQGTTVLLTEVD